MCRVTAGDAGIIVAPDYQPPNAIAAPAYGQLAAPL
jgi:hypothetical protein